MQDSSQLSLEKLISDAFACFDANLRAALPKTAPQIIKLMHGDSPLFQTETVLSAKAFPHYVLPYLLSPARERAVDTQFQTDILYSTVNGSYSIRLCDNIADNDSPPDLRKVAPCVAYFDYEFIRVYLKYFALDHEFWLLFGKFWALQAEASSADSLLNDVDDDTFSLLSSKKFTATKIPIAAVHFRYQNLEHPVERWFHFVDLLGIFAQFNNDFFDWNHDSLYGITTYISSEARRRAPGDSLAKWFLRDGFDWGVSALRAKFDNVKNEAELLGNEAVLNWVIARGHALDREIVEARSGLELVKTFGRITSGKQS
jgi:hypothetical protein